MLQNRRRHLLPPSGVAPLGSSVRSPVWWPLGGFELGAVSQHGVHDDGETAGERNPRFARRRLLTHAAVGREHHGKAADLVLEGDALADQLLTSDDQRPQSVRRQRLHMNWLEEASTGEMR